MTYKVLMLDLDGTTVVSHPKAVPTKRVVDAVAKAAGKITICIATGRSLAEAGYILQELSISGLCILDHGATIYDTAKQQIVRQVSLNQDQIRAAYAVFKRAQMPVYVFGDTTRQEEFDGEPGKNAVIGLWSRGADEQEALVFEEGFSGITGVAVNKTVARDGRGISFEVTHAEATKQHGVLEVSRLLGVSKDEIIGIGDGYNDFPLLMACGLKIAMGNAVPELKAIADFIAPSVDDDGVATVIEKFILL